MKQHIIDFAEMCEGIYLNETFMYGHVWLVFQFSNGTYGDAFCRSLIDNGLGQAVQKLENLTLAVLPGETIFSI